jgi:uroporphyrinogen-III synthase
MTADAALGGIGVLVTRPAHQADGLCRLIEAHAGVAHRFPVLEIGAPVDPRPLRAVAERLEDYDWAIFISANAVDRALQSILAARHWPATTRVAVIGRRSAQSLQRHGLSADLYPSDRFDSEALLALLPMQQVAGQRVVIFRGDGGREHLANTLRERGAQVDYIEAYRRFRPRTDPAPLLAQWRSGAIDIVVVNSGESLRNLVALIGAPGLALLRVTPVLMVSERMLPIARELGLASSPVVAENATDDAVMKALLAWRAGGTN